MAFCLRTQSDLDDALGRLVARDPRLGDILDEAGPVALRRREPGFPGLVAIIVGQQLSTASASAIWGRLSAAFDPFHPEALHRARVDRLRRLGLSAGKVKTLRAVTREIVAGRLDLDAIVADDPDAARAILTAIHGIGPWTADLYLLFCLGLADVWPSGDLALRESVRIGFALPARPNQREIDALSDLWQPWRGVAAHLFWAYYKTVKRRS